MTEKKGEELKLSPIPNKPLQIKSMMDKAYGEDWYVWDSDTLVSTLTSDSGKAQDSYLINKIRALQALRLNNKCYTDFRVFEKIVLAFNELPLDWELVEGATPEELGYAVFEIQAIYPEAEFGREISVYIAGILKEDGFIVSPKPLEFAQAELDKINAGTVAEAAKEKVLSAIDNTKASGKWDPDSLIGQAVNKYASVLAYIRRKVQ